MRVLQIRICFMFLALLSCICSPVAGQRSGLPDQAAPSPERVASKIFETERETNAQMKLFTASAKNRVEITKRSFWLLTFRLRQYDNIGQIDFSSGDSSLQTAKWNLPGNFLWGLFAAGLVSPTPIDPVDFEPATYVLKFEGIDQQDLPGCYIFAVSTTKKAKRGSVHFLGRIWVNPEDSVIVQFQGYYSPSTKLNLTLSESIWFPIFIRRAEIFPHVWLPVKVILENSGKAKEPWFPEFRSVTTFSNFKRESSLSRKTAFSEVLQ